MKINNKTFQQKKQNKQILKDFFYLKLRILKINNNSKNYKKIKNN